MLVVTNITVIAVRYMTFGMETMTKPVTFA